ncbi:MAG: toll/interleukin-1 receptor domain-containing protein, partial [Halobacteriota archaeon]
MGTRDDTLVQEALQSDDISRYLVDEDFARQARLAAAIIVENYRGNDKDERIVQGVVKAANAIRTKVKVFVSYKEKYEHDTREIVTALRAWAGPKLGIWYAHDISPGHDWMQALFEQVTAAHWFLLLLPDSADDWGWQLYEAGIFRGSMLPGDRLICLHHPDVQRAPQLEDYQTVPAEQGAVTRFLEDILVKPNAVPGMDPINSHVQCLPDLAGQIVTAFDRLSTSETVWFGHFVELAVDNAQELTRAEDLNRARIIATQGVEDLFGRQESVDRAWGMLASDLDPISQDSSWITELVNVMREVAEGRIPSRIEATFAGAKGGAGKQFRPQLTSIKRSGSSIESFHISFIEVLERGMAGVEPAGMRSLQTALRLTYRLRWEIIENYKDRYIFNDKDIRTIHNILERLEREAHFHGLLDRAILCDQFGSDAHVV